MAPEVPDLRDGCGWQTASQKIEIIRELISSHGPRVDMLEVGTWTGHGAIHWRAEIAKLPEKGTLTCVDPWRPYHSEQDIARSGMCREMNKLLEADEAYRLFLRNIGFGKHDVPIHHHRATLAEVAHLLPKFEVILIDGSHYYEDVATDIRLARALLKSGGLLVGDDLEKTYDEVDEATVRANPKTDFIDGFHPGVTAAVWDSFGHVPRRSSVWYVQC